MMTRLKPRGREWRLSTVVDIAAIAATRGRIPPRQGASSDRDRSAATLEENR